MNTTGLQNAETQSHTAELDSRETTQGCYSEKCYFNVFIIYNIYKLKFLSEESSKLQMYQMEDNSYC